MKAQIDNLVTLANNYVKYAKEVGLPDTHNRLRDTYDDDQWGVGGPRINVYLADNGIVWAVEFGDVEISGYKKTIEIPFNATSDSLPAIFNDASHFLLNHLIPKKEKYLELSKQVTSDRIASLEQELLTLKNSLK